jgi:hypothetical protein
MQVLSNSQMPPRIAEAHTTMPRSHPLSSVPCKGVKDTQAWLKQYARASVHTLITPMTTADLLKRDQHLQALRRSLYPSAGALPTLAVLGCGMIAVGGACLGAAAFVAAPGAATAALALAGAALVCWGTGLVIERQRAKRNFDVLAKNPLTNGTLSGLRKVSKRLAECALNLDKRFLSPATLAHTA